MNGADEFCAPSSSQPFSFDRGLLDTDHGFLESLMSDPPIVPRTPVSSSQREDAAAEPPAGVPRLPPLRLLSSISPSFSQSPPVRLLPCLSKQSVGGQIKTVFRPDDLIETPGLKSRTACLKFPWVHPDMQAAVMNDITSRMHKAHKLHKGGIGMLVRESSYFTAEDGLWIVLIGYWAPFFSKWHAVYRGLGALDIRVSHVSLHFPGRMRGCLQGAADAFPDDTTVEELSGRLVVYEHDPPKPQKKAGTHCKADARSHSRRSGSPQAKSKKRVREASNSPPPPAASGSAASVDAIVEGPAAGHFALPQLDPRCSGETRGVVQACLQFLTAPDLSQLQPCRDSLFALLEKTFDTTQLGLFLLSGRLCEMFDQVVRMRTHVLHVLRTHYGIRLDRITPTSVGELVGQCRVMSQASRDALLALACFEDVESVKPVFQLFDPVGLLLLFLLALLLPAVLTPRACWQGRWRRSSLSPSIS